MSDAQEHLAMMLRIVGIEKATVRNIEKVWIAIRVWEYAVRCSRWAADAGLSCFVASRKTSMGRAVSCEAHTIRASSLGY
ncbi:hypothetical protein AB0A98_06145 [Streptomyces chrestomyceticus]|uniref:hypothetical protein n=1 Tax=Streptomyces chrestomyceticus TaxID=68185 RepID=UPI0033D7F172